MNEMDMVTDDERRWLAGIHGLPTRSAKIKDLSSFDASFFGIHPKQAHVMDPQLRMLLEVTYEAIVDAGVNPSTVRGSRTGVFIGVSFSETDEFWMKDVETINGLYIMKNSAEYLLSQLYFNFFLSAAKQGILLKFHSNLKY